MKFRNSKHNTIRLFVLLLLCLVCAYTFQVHAQESCYEQYLREHNMTILTAEDADDSYEEQKKAALAKQMYDDSYLLMLDTVAERAVIAKADGTYIADVYMALVDSTWYMWLSVDPLADKYPNVTPYIYCNGNPVMLVDPDGRDTLFVNSNGSAKSYVKHEGGNDVINMVKRDGTIYESYSMPKNTMHCVEGKTNSDGLYTSFVVSIKGDKDGMNAYEFIANKMSGTIEWALVQSGDKSTGENYLGTNNLQGRNTIQSRIIRNILPVGANIRHASHSHPTNPNYTKDIDDTAAKKLLEDNRNKFAEDAIFTIYAVSDMCYKIIDISEK